MPFGMDFKADSRLEPPHQKTNPIKWRQHFEAAHELASREIERKRRKIEEHIQSYIKGELLSSLLANTPIWEYEPIIGKERDCHRGRQSTFASFILGSA